MRNFKLGCAALLSLFILTQCASNDGVARRAVVNVIQSQPQQAYPPQRYYYPQPSQNYNQYYGAPNSRSYSNPYDFEPTQNQGPSQSGATNPVRDNDEYYVPTERL